MKSVWLFKSETDSNQKYEEILRKNDFICETVPTLDFKFINKSSLLEALQTPDKFSGIIFTSSRAVQALEDEYRNLPLSLHQQWSNKKIFAIGKSTTLLVKEKLSLESLGSVAGNAKELGPIILEMTKPFDKPLFFPCGNLKREELPIFLAKNDRDFRAITCYETKKHLQLETTLCKLAAAHQPSFVVFFSPSGVRFALPLFSKHNISLTGIKIIAIGPTTNTALANYNAVVSGICPEPSPEGLIQVLRSF